MFGLIDCNNFFVSCERVFNPALRNRPVIVFSNNDGCAVALSNEAKALGLKRGDPFFMIKDICDAKGVTALSGNHRLYGDMSSRVMAVVASLVPEIEIYSVDEAFIHLTENESKDSYEAFGRNIVKTVRRSTGIPTALGIAPTKTLAKIAARFAKKYNGYRGCCVICDEPSRRKALSLTPVTDVWGIGRRLGKKLTARGITTALQLADLAKDEASALFNVVSERTWRELNGQPCGDIAEINQPRKQMCCSRSFGDPIDDFEELSAAMTALATSISRRLRKYRLCALSMTVFIYTNTFRHNRGQYSNSAFHSFDEAKSDTLSLTSAATACLHKIFRRGYGYKKAGILINELSDADAIQQSLFVSDDDRDKRQRLMKAFDAINSNSLTHDLLHTASYLPVNEFVRHEMSSRYYTTRMTDIIKITI